MLYYFEDAELFAECDPEDEAWLQGDVLTAKLAPDVLAGDASTEGLCKGKDDVQCRGLKLSSRIRY